MGILPMKSGNFILKFSIPFVVILAGVFALLHFGNQLIPQKNSQKNKISSDVEWTLTGLNGVEVKWESLAAKLVIMNFWATWCTPCLIEIPSLVRLRRAFHAKGVELVLVNLDDNPQKMVPPFLEKWQIDFTVYHDPSQRLSSVFDVNALPLTVVLNQQKKILYRETGERDWNAPEVHHQINHWLSHE